MGDLKPINTTTAEGVSTITLAAVPENFAAAQEQVRSFLDSASCSMRTLFELDMVVEEIFINVASYAYPDGAGTVSLARVAGLRLLFPKKWLFQSSPR